MSSDDKKNRQFNILKKYFEDAATKEEEELVNEWFSDPENVSGFKDSLRFLWQETNPGIRRRGIDLDALLDKVHHVINLSGKKEQIKSLPVQSGADGPFGHILRNIARVAAILLLPLMAYIGWEIYSQKMWENSQALVVYNEIICPLGARSRFDLPDGTQGWLNNGSRLKYPVMFLGKSREIELTGEAYFDVAHDRNRPFIINTDGLDIRVLGTRLNVQAYPEENYQTVTLESGSAELIGRNRDRELSVIEMKPGQHAVYYINKNHMDIGPVENQQRKEISIDMRDEKSKTANPDKEPADRTEFEMVNGKVDVGFEETSNYTVWKDGKLVLRNDPMSVMLNRIGRWYNVKFNITDKRINEYTYWATFEEENLDKVLEMLSLTGPIDFVKRPRKQMRDGTYAVQEIDITIKDD